LTSCFDFICLAVGFVKQGQVDGLALGKSDVSR